MKTTIHDGDGDSRHGTLNGYCNLRCRCGECRTAMAGYAAKAKARRAAALEAGTEVRHESYITYGNYKCRCTPCKTAWATYSRELDARRRAAS